MAVSYQTSANTQPMASADRCPKCGTLLWPAGTPCPRCHHGKKRSPAKPRVRVVQPAVQRGARGPARRTIQGERTSNPLSITIVSLVCLLLLSTFFRFAWRLSIVSRLATEVKQGNLSTVQAMCGSEPKLINAHGYLGRTPLYWAAANGRDGVMHWLLEQQVDVNEADQHGCTPLYMAAERGQVSSIQILLQSGANPWTRDAQGWTPLHAAAAGGNITALHCLLDESPLTLNERDYHGLTPLHVAAIAGQAPIVDHILQMGADANPKTNNGETPLHLARARSHNPIIISLLSDHGGQ